jgi:hypothetical protein
VVTIIGVPRLIPVLQPRVATPSQNLGNQLEEFSGAPGGARTPDLLIRSQSLYPAELRARTDSIIAADDTMALWIRRWKRK